MNAFYKINTTNKQITIDGTAAMLIDGKGTYFGMGAGTNVTYGGYNCLFGNAAGTSLTTGGDNCFFGQNTGAYTTIGGYNVGLGRDTLFYNVDGGGNIGIGLSVLVNNVSGWFNVGIGYLALAGSYGSSPNYNVAIGTSAGQITTGSYNIFIGNAAADTNTTGSYNIVIGYNIDLPAANSTAMLDIGNLIYATGLGATGTTLSTGKVGIGVVAPTNTLHVAGSVAIGSPSHTDGVLNIESGRADLSASTNLVYMGVGTSSNYAGFNFQGCAASDMFFGRANSSDDLIISSMGGSATEIIRFKQAGKVGILDNNPAEVLDVTGNINSTGVIKIDDVQVVSNRVVDARCDDAINDTTWDSTTAGVLDSLRDCLISHGLLSAS
jgi:hypothetical protein